MLVDHPGVMMVVEGAHGKLLVFKPIIVEAEKTSNKGLIVQCLVHNITAFCVG